MSGAGIAKRPRVRFCWVCSRQLHGNFHRVAVVDGNQVIVHADCAKRERLDVIEGADRVDPIAEQKANARKVAGIGGR